MKIFSNNQINSTESNQKKDSFNFRAKIPVTVMSPNNWKSFSAATASLGIVGIALNIPNQNEIEKLKNILSTQAVYWKPSGVKNPVHRPEKIDLIVEMYKTNPDLVSRAIRMTSENSIVIGPRFLAEGIKTLVESAKINPALVQKLLYKGTVYDNKIDDYAYNAETIEAIVKLSEKYPEFIDKVISIDRPISNRGYTPKYTSLFELKSLIEAYEKNSVLTEALVSDQNIRAVDILDFSRTFENIDFYKELKESLGEEDINEIENIKKLNRFTNLIKSDLKGMDFEDKLFMLVLKEKLPPETLAVYEKYYPDFDIKMNQVKMALGLYKNNIATALDSQKLFVENILANNNPQVENVIKTFDFAQFGKAGLPLKYSRKDFLAKIEKLIENLDEKEQNVLLQHFGMIEGYEDVDGLLTNKPLKEASLSEEARNIAVQIQEEIKTFTEENEVITGNTEADKILTGLIKGLPEFTFFIGKKQHDTHNYSVDIHTLKVLQSAMNHPLYDDLSDIGKTVLKLSILLHDFGKKGNVKDPGHAALSGAYASGILKKFPFKEELKNRIVDVINNHHWFEGYNLGDTKPHQVAALCRYPEDLIIYQIFAKADFENINNEFHIENSEGVNNQAEFDEFMEKKMISIYKSFVKMRTLSNFVFDTRFLHNGEKFPTEIVDVDGEQFELKVLDFNKLLDGENLEKYGFLPGTTKENAHFLVHMTRLINLYGTKKLVENTSNKVAWSASLVKNDSNTTIDKYGFIYNADQANISIGYKDNLSLGNHRSFEDFVRVLFLDEEDELGFYKKKLTGKRTYLRDKFLENLAEKGIKLTKMEYLMLAEYITSKKYITQIREDIPVSENKIIKASHIVEALEYSRASLFEGDEHCEVDCVNPTIVGLYAKASSIEMCDKKFLKFAKDNNLPIILMHS